MESSFQEVCEIRSSGDVNKAAESLAGPYATMRWKWAFVGVPTARNVGATIRSLIRDTRKRTTSMGTGGIRIDRRDGVPVLMADKRLTDLLR